MSTVDVSIVIVNWNAGEYLVRAVASAFADPFPGVIEVLVVDNASADGSPALVQRAEPRARVMAMGKNTGFARACNAGVRASRGRYVLLLNPDAEIRPGALAALAGAGDAYPDAAVIGGFVVAPDGTFDPASCRNVPTPGAAFARLFGLPGLARWRGLAPYNLPVATSGHAPEVGAVSGSFLLLRRAAFDHLGGLDEQFFLYAEDLDFCHRARLAGWTVRSVSAAVAVHHKHVCAAQAPYRTLRHFYWTMALFHRKHYAARYPRVVNLAVYAGVGALLVVRLLATLLARPGTRFRLATASRRARRTATELAGGV